MNASADMMASAITARTGHGIFPRINVGRKGVKITRPGYYNVPKSDGYMAWVTGNICCGASS